MDCKLIAHCSHYTCLAHIYWIFIFLFLSFFDWPLCLSRKSRTKITYYISLKFRLRIGYGRRKRMKITKHLFRINVSLWLHMKSQNNHLPPNTYHLLLNEYFVAFYLVRHFFPFIFFCLPTWIVNGLEIRKVSYRLFFDSNVCIEKKILNNNNM